MADPWTDDLAAFGEDTRAQLGSLAHTRARLRMEPQMKMNVFKRRPLFAIAVTALVLAVAAPVAWAIGTKIFVTFDPDKTAPEIEQDISHQLESAGVTATVHADKSDGRLSVRIQGSGEALDHARLEVVPSGSAGVTIERHGSAASSQVVRRQIRLEVQSEQKLGDAAMAKLQAALASPAVTDALEGDDLEHLEEVATDALADAGFHAVTVEASAGGLTVVVTGPPTP